jgi:hypothetical protein
MAYGEYLKGESWKRIRRLVLRRDRGRCRSCGRRAWQVHHASYERAVLEGRDLSQLFALCGTCHLAATFTITGAKRTKAEMIEMGAVLNAPNPKPPKVKKAKKPKRPKLSIDGIRALSLLYAEGRRS